MGSEFDFDAVVVGAGPAGAACAQPLAKAGWRVALVEKTAFPRPKVCGEFLSATSLPVLEACGIADAYADAAGPPVTRIGLYAGHAMIASKQERLWGRALSRTLLDTLLRDAAVAAGAKLFQPAEVVTLDVGNGVNAVMLDDGKRLTARKVIAACGSWNAKGPFALPQTNRPSDLLAFKAHFRDGQLPQGLMPLLAFPGGYGGLVQSDDDLLSLSCCIRRDVLGVARQRHGGKAADAVIAHIRATTSGVDFALRGARLAGAPLAAGPIHPGIWARRDADVCFTGNLAGEAHPVIAEGISMAIQASHLLARLLIAARDDEYPEAWRSQFAARLHAARIFAHLAMNAAARTALPAVAAIFPQLLDWGARRSGKVPNCA